MTKWPISTFYECNIFDSQSTMRTGHAILKCRISDNHENNVIYNVLETMFGLSVSLFEKTPLLQVLSSTDYEDKTFDDDNQLNLLL